MRSSLNSHWWRYATPWRLLLYREAQGPGEPDSEAGERDPPPPGLDSTRFGETPRRNLRLLCVALCREAFFLPSPYLVQEHRTDRLNMLVKAERVAEHEGPFAPPAAADAHELELMQAVGLLILSREAQACAHDTILEHALERLAEMIVDQLPSHGYSRGARAAYSVRRQQILLRLSHLVRDVLGDPWEPTHFVVPCSDCGGCGEEGPCGLTDYWRGCSTCNLYRHGPVPGQRPAPWLTPQVGQLARAAYGERPENPLVCGCTSRHYLTRCLCRTRQGSRRRQRHQPFPVTPHALDPLTLLALADALEEAGCTWERLLQHLRGWDPRPLHVPVDGWGWRPIDLHVRGCWAVDGILRALHHFEPRQHRA